MLSLFMACTRLRYYRICFSFTFILLFLAFVGGCNEREEPISRITTQEIQKLVAENKGKVVVLNFWASWCAPCRLEIPDLIRIRNEFPRNEVVMIGISVDSNKESLLGFLRKEKINYPVFWATPEVLRNFQVGPIPRTDIWDTTGKKVVQQEGYLDHSQLERIMFDLLTG